MNLPSRTSAVLTDLKGGISEATQSTRQLKQEWTSLGQVIQTAGSRAGGLAKIGGPGGMSSTKIAPDPNFGGQQQSSNNLVFNSPAQNAIVGGYGGGGDLVPPGGGGYGGGGGGGGGGGNGMFRNLSEYVSQNRTGAILYGAGTALGSAHATSDMVQSQLLMQRAAAFMPKDPGLSLGESIRSTSGLGGIFSAGGFGDPLVSRYEYVRRSAEAMAKGGAPNDKMDAFNAMAAAQSYGINGPNFMQRAGTNDQFAGSVMSGISNVSNLTPGMGLEGTTRAYGGMQRGRSVNMLRGVGIKIRDENGNMKPMDVIIDDLWTKICRDVMKDGKGKPTEQEMLIGFQPGNSMDSMVQNLFGDDPLVYTAIKNGLIYKAKTGGASINRDGANDAGMTTNAVQTRQQAMALGTQGLGQSANAGSFSFTGAQGGLNFLAQGALEIDDKMGVLGPLKALNSLAALMQTLGGAGGGIGNSVMGFLMAMLGLKGKAEGGHVGGATPYMVGEKGPELFIPKTDGVIIPNHLGPTRHEGGGVSAKGHSHSWGKNAKNPTEIKSILAGAGFTGQALEDALKIAQGESGYNPFAANFNKGTGDESYGLFQINMLDNLGPGRRQWFGIKKNEELYDVHKNAKAAYSIFKAKGYRFDKDWVTQSKKYGLVNRVYDKGTGAGTGGDGSASGTDGATSPTLTTDENTAIKNSFISVYGDKKGAELFKAFQEYNKTGNLPEGTTVGSMLGLNSSDASAMVAAMGGGGGSTVNYGGVTFNITTPADNKSFVDSVKQALKDLNFLKIGKD
jgi:hypothetical protein